MSAGKRTCGALISGFLTIRGRLSARERSARFIIVDETHAWRRFDGFALEFVGNVEVPIRRHAIGAARSLRFDWDAALDFLVAGLGFGALLVLAGYAVREFGVLLFVPPRIRNTFDDDEETASAWRGLCRLGSNVAMLAGVIVWFVVIAAVALSVSDGTGALLFAGTATLVSVVGAAVIYWRSRHLHDPAVAAHTDVSAASAGWHEDGPVLESDIGPVEDWKPKLLPKSTATIIEDIPVWGAMRELPLPDEAAAGVAAEASPTMVDEPTLAGAVETPQPTVEPDAPADDLAAEPAGVHVSSSAAPSENANDVEPAPAPDPESVRVEAPIADAPALEPALEAVAVELAPIEVDQLISEAPSPDRRLNDAELVSSPQRFKSALLSDLDEPKAVEANAIFKSALLSDLSAVRLPDDGPRFRSTTLLDVSESSDSDAESSPTDRARPHRS